MGNFAQIETLVSQLKKASDDYYNSGSSIMSDEEFDNLVDQLRQLDPNNEFLQTIGAPVKIGAWPKKKHKYFMGSQNKVKTKEDFMKWAEGKGPLVITDKLDGSTIALYYENGKLTDAVSRGGGDEGEILTSNVLRMQNVKAEIDGFTGVLRGEMIIYLSDFDKHIKPLGYKNARNACSGLSRDTSDSELVPHIKVIYFDVISESSELKTEIEKENFIHKTADLKYVWIRGPYGDHEAAWKQFENRIQTRPTLDFECDGVVVKEDDLTIQKERGDLNGRPRGQVAIKYQSQSKETIVKDITWQLGRNGRLSPVLELEPIDLGGVTVSRCTGNNKDYLKTLGISIGCTAVIGRANDVIPCCQSVIKAGNGTTNEPTNCPTCNGILETDGAYLLCAMLDCQGKVIGDLAIWIRATKIKGVGPNVLSALIDIGVDDAFKFMMAEREKFHDACKGEKNGDKLYEQVRALKKMELATLLYGLNIPHCGEINSRRLEKHFKTLPALLEASATELAEVEGIKTTSEDIWVSIHNKVDVINNLCEIIDILRPVDKGPLAGTSVCVTGELSMGRDFVHDWIRSKGGEVKTGVSKGLTYLVTNNPGSGSSKNQKATKLGVKVIDEAELLKLGNSISFQP